MKLWLDDVRPPHIHGRLGWMWVKTAADAIEALKVGDVEEASLDHDLAYEHYLQQPSQTMTGYDVVKWMEENNVWPKVVYVHSLNPVGAQRMMDVLSRHTRAVRQPVKFDL